MSDSVYKVIELVGTSEVYMPRGSAPRRMKNVLDW